MRTYLIVSFKEKEQVKKLGARWDSGRKAWFVENVEEIGLFLSYMPKHLKKPIK